MKESMNELGQSMDSLMEKMMNGETVDWRDDVLMVGWMDRRID